MECICIVVLSLIGNQGHTLNNKCYYNIYVKYFFFTFRMQFCVYKNIQYEFHCQNSALALDQRISVCGGSPYCVIFVITFRDNIFDQGWMHYLSFVTGLTFHAVM